MERGEIEKAKNLGDRVIPENKASHLASPIIFSGTAREAGRMKIEAEQVKAAVDCRDLALHLGIQITKKTGANWTAKCFNIQGHKHGDRNPSLSIGRDGFNCFASGCGVKGDCFTLVQRLRGCDFKEALAYLVDHAGLNGNAPSGPLPARQSSTRKAPSRETIPEARLTVMRAFWDRLEGLPLTGEAEAWLRGRGISPLVAADLGCRDLWPVRQEVQTLLKRFSVQEKLASGFFNADEKLWGVLAGAIGGREDERGLLVPVCRPEHDFPLGWRWRLYRPSARVKVIAQPGGGLAPLLGLQTFAVSLLERVGNHPTTIICEGEPDWLSLYDALQADAAVLGLCAIARGWEDEWTRCLDGSQKVLIMVHDDEGGGQKLSDEIYLSMVKRWGLAATEERVARCLLPGNDDANDMHRRGELRPLVQQRLAGIGG